MKKLFRTFTVAALVISMLASCQKDEVNGNAETIDGKKVTENVVNSFNKKYPGATNVMWENKVPYWIAHFDLNKTRSIEIEPRENTTWFDEEGNWCMAEHDIEYIALPETVKAAFESTEYALWKIDEVEILEREGVIELYVIEVEKQDSSKEMEIELYYSADGILVKEVADQEEREELIPFELPENIIADLEKGFPGYELIEADEEDDLFEVKIMSAGRVYELTYDEHLNWLSTEYDICIEEVPENILDALYQAIVIPEGFEAEEVEVTENRDGIIYEFEFENDKLDKEIELTINGKGEIL